EAGCGTGTAFTLGAGRVGAGGAGVGFTTGAGGATGDGAGLASTDGAAMGLGTATEGWVGACDAVTGTAGRVGAGETTVAGDTEVCGTGLCWTLTFTRTGRWKK